MALTYSFRTARDLFDKLERDHAKLKETVSGDAFFNFVVTAYHLREWVKKDQNPLNAARKLAKNFEC